MSSRTPLSIFAILAAINGALLLLWVTSPADPVWTTAFSLTGLLAGPVVAGLLVSRLDAAPPAATTPAPDTTPEVMERMASMLAHDLCNALSAVKVNLQILARQLAPDAAQHAERCRIALDQVDQIEHTIGDLQSFARPGSGEREPTDLRELINTALVDCLAAMESKRIRITRREAGGLPRIDGDRKRLAQVLLQILDNAIDASEPEGSIIVTARPDGKSAGWVEILISDNGCGMSEEVLHRATEPFFTTKARGSGLGLSIAERVVSHHGGTLDIRSSPEDGTTVLIRLPSVA